jgi:hypothetical protein
MFCALRPWSYAVRQLKVAFGAGFTNGYSSPSVRNENRIQRGLCWRSRESCHRRYTTSEGGRGVTQGVIGSTYRLPCIDMPRIDIPRLGSTFRFHISHCHVTYITMCDGPARHVSNCHVTYITICDGPARHVSICHVTHITTCDGNGTPRILFPALITPNTQYL